MPTISLHFIYIKVFFYLFFFFLHEKKNSCLEQCGEASLTFCQKHFVVH